MGTPIAYTPLPGDVDSEALIRTLLAMAPVGMLLLRPRYTEAAGTGISDFTWVQLNPVAQQQLHLPECPSPSLLTQFPAAQEAGLFAFCRDAFLSGQEERRQGLYQLDGFDGAYQFVAQRQGPLLVVSLTAASEQPASAGADSQQNGIAHARSASVLSPETADQLYQTLQQLPSGVAVYEGPTHVLTFYNEVHRELAGRPLTLGKSAAELFPELVGQAFFHLPDQVYATGEPAVLVEIPAQLRQPGTGELTQHYFTIRYSPRRDAAGQVTGLLVTATPVTEQVLARQQVQRLNEELTARNEEHLATNATLGQTQQQLQHLNQELEARVQARTAEALALQADLLAAAQRQVQQQAEFYQVFEQAPVVVALLRGPEHFFQYRNPAFQGLFPGRALTGQLYAEAMPEIVAAGLLPELDWVYATGQPYYGTALPVVTTPPDGSAPHQRYYDFSYQPYREAGQLVGVSIFAYDVTEQVRARQQREAQRRELYALFEQAPAGVSIMAGPELVFEFVNPAYQRLLPGRELLGHSILAALPELRGTEVETSLRQVYATGETHQAQEQCIPVARPDGTGELEDRYFTFVYQARRDEDDRVTGILNFVFEVTEQVVARRQVEQLNADLEARVQARTRELRKAQAATEREHTQLQALLTQAPVAIALFQGPEVRVASANEQMAALWGRTPAQVVGHTLLEAVPELRGQGFEEMIQAVQATRVPYIGTEAPATILQDGKLVDRYYNFSCQPVYDAQGELLGVLNVGTEVTEQVETRRALEQLNQNLEARVQARTQELSEQQLLLSRILGQVPAAIATLSGPDHRFSFFNEDYQAIVSGRARLRQRLVDCVPEVVEQGFVNLLDQVYLTGEPFIGTEVPAQLYDTRLGQFQQHYVDFVYQPLFNDRQQVLGILAFILDVTDKVGARQQVQRLNEELAATNGALTKTNEELHRSNTQLTRTNADLDMFVYAASHDLKAPIANIEGLLDALREYLPTAEQQPLVPRLVAMMEGAITRFQQTVGHLTDVSRFQQASEQSSAEVADLAQVLTDVALDLQPLLDSTHAELLVDTADCAPVQFSTKNLRSVLFNLLSNAVKYRDPARAPRVQVRTHCTPTHLVLAVQDNGLGLSKSQQDKLFKLFKRLHAHVEGSGVGLYLIKRLLENAGGTITVQSEAGVGSTFTVTLPRAPREILS